MKIRKPEINRLMIDDRLRELTSEEKFRELSEALENPEKCFHEYDGNTCKFCGVVRTKLFD